MLLGIPLKKEDRKSLIFALTWQSRHSLQGEAPSRGHHAVRDPGTHLVPAADNCLKNLPSKGSYEGGEDTRGGLELGS